MLGGMGQRASATSVTSTAGLQDPIQASRTRSVEIYLASFRTVPHISSQELGYFLAYRGWHCCTCSPSLVQKCNTILVTFSPTTLRVALRGYRVTWDENLVQLYDGIYRGVLDLDSTI